MFHTFYAERNISLFRNKVSDNTSLDLATERKDFIVIFLFFQGQANKVDLNFNLYL